MQEMVYVTVSYKHSRAADFSVRRGSVGGSVDVEPVVEDDIDEDDFGPDPKQDITQIHVTTLDSVCSVSWFEIFHKDRCSVLQ